MRGIPFYVSVGFYNVGVVSIGSTSEVDANDYALRIFGFNDHKEYCQYYPMGPNDTIEGPDCYKEAYLNSEPDFCDPALYFSRQMLFTPEFDVLGYRMRNVCDMYFYPLKSGDYNRLYIFPTIEQLREMFLHEELKLNPNCYWFCIDWGM